MPALSQLYADADLEMAMGGAYRVVELAGATSTADATYTAFLARVRAGAQSMVYRIMGIAFDPLDAVATGSDTAATLCLSIAIYYCWFYGTGGQAIPVAVMTEKENAELALRAIREGESGMGTASEPTSKTGAGTVVLTGDKSRVLRSNMGRFC